MRYFIDTDGNDINTQEGEYDHVDLARRILPAELVARLREMADYDGHYTEMFARGFVRAREERDWLMLEACNADGSGKAFKHLTAAQRRSIQAKAIGFTNVSYNSERFALMRETGE